MRFLTVWPSANLPRTVVVHEEQPHLAVDIGVGAGVGDGVVGSIVGFIVGTFVGLTEGEELGVRVGFGVRTGVCGSQRQMSGNSDATFSHATASLSPSLLCSHEIRLPQLYEPVPSVAIASQTC